MSTVSATEKNIATMIMKRIWKITTFTDEDDDDIQ